MVNECWRFDAQHTRALATRVYDRTLKSWASDLPPIFLENQNDRRPARTRGRLQGQDQEEVQKVESRRCRGCCRVNGVDAYAGGCPHRWSVCYAPSSPFANNECDVPLPADDASEVPSKKARKEHKKHKKDKSSSKPASGEDTPMVLERAFPTQYR